MLKIYKLAVRAAVSAVLITLATSAPAQGLLDTLKDEQVRDLFAFLAADPPRRPFRPPCLAPPPKRMPAGS